jgi:hypothetical protein
MGLEVLGEAIGSTFSGFNPNAFNPLSVRPDFLFGEPKREWDFYFQMIPNINPVTEGAKTLLDLLSILPLLYVSGLAEKVTPPSDKFIVEPAQLSTLQVPFPKGFDVTTFQVQYLEDEWGLVNTFHRIWQNGIRGFAQGGVVFEELGKVCCSAIYGGSRKLSGQGFLPTSLEVFPAIFPIEISRDPANRGGNNLSKVTVSYARFPVWSMKGNIYEWRDKEGNEKVVPGGWFGDKEKVASGEGSK